MRALRVLAFAVAALACADAAAYVLPARAVFRRFAEKQALDRAQSGLLAGRATLADAAGTREVPVQLEVKLPGGCRTALELPEGNSTASVAAGRLQLEGGEVPALSALVALGCPFATMKNLPASDAESALARMASALGVDLEVSSLSRLGARPAWVVGAKPRQLDRPQIWFDKETLRPVRIVGKHGGQWWDVRYDDPLSPATARRHPRIAEVWQGAERVLALKLMASDVEEAQAPAATPEDAEEEQPE